VTDPAVRWDPWGQSNQHAPDPWGRWARLVLLNQQVRGQWGQWGLWGRWGHEDPSDRLVQGGPQGKLLGATSPEDLCRRAAPAAPAAPGCCCPHLEVPVGRCHQAQLSRGCQAGP